MLGIFVYNKNPLNWIFIGQSKNGMKCLGGGGAFVMCVCVFYFELQGKDLDIVGYILQHKSGLGF